MPFAPTQGFLPAWVHPYPHGWESQTCQSACCASPEDVPVPTYCTLKVYIVHWVSVHPYKEAELGTQQLNSFTPVYVCSGAFISSYKSHFSFSSTTLVHTDPNKNIGSHLYFSFLKNPIFPPWEPFSRVDPTSLTCQPPRH